MSTITNKQLTNLYQTKSAKEIFTNSASETKKQSMIEKLKDQSGHIEDDDLLCLALVGAACCLAAC